MAESKTEVPDEEEVWTVRCWDHLDKPTRREIQGVKPGETISTLKKRIVESFGYPHESFQLQPAHQSPTKTLGDDETFDKNISINIVHLNRHRNQMAEHALRERSVTPTTNSTSTPSASAAASQAPLALTYGPHPPAGYAYGGAGSYAGNSSSYSYSYSGSSSYNDWNKKSKTGYVGLSNQGATCYMNSLIQTLFMTPEFRSALYAWSFEDSHARWLQDPAHQPKATDTQTVEEVAHEMKMKREKESIPRQLQLLFANLQMSDEKTVKTKRLTKSFGWADSEAFTQHDVQELLRVLFDALEKVLKGTDQENLINGLYQGEMKDFVRCKECNHESSRADKYLDIPLVIRGFGETTAVKSVEEALGKFTATELLEGKNLYKCDRCNKMVEAEKGLKFVDFPYLLTLQLKRFDFDFATERRIKLNDRVSFPFLLDLNHLITARDDPQADDADQEVKKRKVDEKMEEVEDETKDLKGEEDPTTPVPQHVERFKKQAEELLKKGPYVYELYSVLIHKGSALGGHYYAYIKDMAEGKWMDFNDSTVTSITEEQVRDTFGEDEQPRKYSSYGGSMMSMWNGGANAYMLMYRRVDPSQNRLLPTTDQIPAELKEAISAEEELVREKAEAKQREKEMIEVLIRSEDATCAVKVKKSTPWSEFLGLVASKTGISERVAPENFRLRLMVDGVPKQPLDKPSYNPMETHKVLEEKPRYYMSTSTKSFDVYLETKEAGTEFEPVSGDDTILEVSAYDHNTNQFTKAKFMAFSPSTSVPDFKARLAQTFNFQVENMRIQVQKKSYYSKIEIVEFDPAEHQLNHGDGAKIFLEDSTQFPNMEDSPWKKELERRKNIVEIMYSVPPSDESYVFQVDQEAMTLAELRDLLSARVKIPPQEFKIYRINSSNYKFELKGESKVLSELFYTTSRAQSLQIVRGTPTSTLEMTPFLLYNCEKNSLEDLFEFHVKPNTLISELKVDLASKLKVEKQVEVAPSRIRLRYISMDKPTDVFPDHKTLKEARARFYGQRVAVEILDSDEIWKEGDTLLTCQQFLPAKFEVGPRFQVAVTDEMTVAEFRKYLGEKFNIEHVGLYKPFYNTDDLLDIPKASWDRFFSLKKVDEDGSLLSVWNLREGDLVFFRDNDEPLRTLTPEEIKDIKKKSAKSKNRYYSKEEALTINTNQ
eukprot:TRINITY_DN8089_c0_g2_i3.p1 TRINITY_DN8089_c0_g2~~TRINITY_DN8089_c0_g2_i3.p1  ORF type:complete len:1165 (-),score=386.65 TRINITY_DN8089_c0_g2_i3:60-3554(-)